jgi:SAM-dependent methyltransferase
VSIYDHNYFETGEQNHCSCYTNYRWLPALTIPMARSIAETLPLSPEDWILDFGCAKGYLVKALRRLGHGRAYGVDASEYAISKADQETRPFLAVIADGVLPQTMGAGSWDWILAKDVLEHLSEQYLAIILRRFRTTAHKVFAVVPLGDGSHYLIPEMERDITHQIRRPLGWWERQFLDAGFAKVRTSYKMAGVKENWTSKYPKGNGFFIATA